MVIISTDYENADHPAMSSPAGRLLSFRDLSSFLGSQTNITSGLDFGGLPQHS